MNSELATILRKLFHAKILAQLPEFVKTGTAFGGVIYRKQTDLMLPNIFIFLELDPKFDRFTFEFAASSGPDFPFDILPGERAASGATRDRIRKYLDPDADGWWRANLSDQSLDMNVLMNIHSKQKMKEAVDRIPDLVNDSFEKLLGVLPKFLSSIDERKS